MHQSCRKCIEIPARSTVKLHHIFGILLATRNSSTLSKHRWVFFFKNTMTLTAALRAFRKHRPGVEFLTNITGSLWILLLMHFFQKYRCGPFQNLGGFTEMCHPLHHSRHVLHDESLSCSATRQPLSDVDVDFGNYLHSSINQFKWTEMSNRCISVQVNEEKSLMRQTRSSVHTDFWNFGMYEQKNFRNPWPELRVLLANFFSRTEGATPGSCGLKIDLYLFQLIFFLSELQVSQSLWNVVFE